METYTFLRALADSWVLLLMTVFFIGTILWAFRPGSREVHRDTANIPFRNEAIAVPKTSSSNSAHKNDSPTDQEPVE
ncbi:MAG: cbb3-type cytochrome c oxidase subunit 3 [Sulfitobacter sp.]